MIKNCEIIRDLLQSALGNAIKTYWVGMPVSFAESTIPALVVRPATEKINIIDNQRDQRDSVIEVILLTSIKDYVEGDPYYVAGLKEASDIIGGEDTMPALKTNTILYQIRHNLNLDSYSNRYIANVVDIDYSRDPISAGQNHIKPIVLTLTIQRFANR
jgi:hypothetical protein